MENKLRNSEAKLSENKILLIKADFHENSFFNLSFLMTPKQNHSCMYMYFMYGNSRT